MSYNSWKGGKKKNKYNAKKVLFNGVLFDSKRELRMYQMFKKHNIPFEMQYKVVLSPSFKDAANTTVKQIYMKVDFVVPYNDIKLYIDTKGVVTPDANNKFKLLKYKIYQEGNKDLVFLPNTNKKVDDLVIKISNNLI
jgi:hypothetical protein